MRVVYPFPAIRSPSRSCSSDSPCERKLYLIPESGALSSLDDLAGVFNFEMQPELWMRAALTTAVSSDCWQRTVLLGKPVIPYFLICRLACRYRGGVCFMPGWLSVHLALLGAC